MTMAVDREALEAVIYEHLYDNSPGDIADAILASGILRDVREVQHQHGERIAEALIPQWQLRKQGARDAYPTVRVERVRAVAAINRCIDDLRAVLACDLSPAPEAKP